MADLTAGAIITVKGENGVVFDQTVPADGSTQRELLEYMLDSKRMELVDVGEVADEATDDEDVPNAEPTDDPPPSRSAPKDEWVAYAVHVGADEDEAKASTKGDLIDRYGG